MATKEQLPPNDLKSLMKDHYIRYASYVILDRAIPDIHDGLKPVQRRILQTLFNMHDGKLHKVANVAGQTMALHPHGDAPITDALVNLANKGFLLDRQGNFGNLYTGDPAAASRYIEARLSDLATETMFNPDLTEMIPSYDGRNQEPVTLPAKIPLLLMQGADGIAVGMVTRILPHNFVELLEAEIAILDGRPIQLLPDFLTGGIMDASDYSAGKGKIKLRATIEVRDPKSVVITEICYGTTTESLIHSIDEAAKRGKIRIDSISDYTSDKVEIEIKLPRGYYAEDLIEKLYAYTECEVTLHSHVTVVKEGFPVETNVDDILRHNTERLKGYLQRELEIEQERLKEKIFEKTLEELFIEHRMYKQIEELKSYEKIHEVIAHQFKPFHKQLLRVPTEEDRERLLNIPIRRISRFDFEKNQNDIKVLGEKLSLCEKNLKQIKKYTIQYLQNLLKKYSKEFPRRTRVKQIETIDLRAIETKEVTVGFDPKQNFVGTKVRGDYELTCTNFDKVLVLFADGTFKVRSLGEKDYLGPIQVAFVGIADKETIFNVAYLDPKTKIAYAKRFVVGKFILDKEYRYFDEGAKLEYLTTTSDVDLEVRLIPKPRQKVSTIDFNFKNIAVKGVAAKGIRMTPRPIKAIKVKDKELLKQLDLFTSG